jgi:riboflavin biosynthesis pyrimidine reductase
LPAPETDLDLDALAEHYAYPAGGALRANMVASIDGAITLDGKSAPISGDADWYLFGLQRALADAIIVGAGTAREEGYGPGRAREEFAHVRAAAGQPAAPTLVLVSARAHLEPGGDYFGGMTRAVVVTCESSPAERRAALAEVADVVVCGEMTVDLVAAVAVLRDRGLRRLLTEGGPHLLGSLTNAGLVDEMGCTFSPVLAGGGSGRMVAGAEGEARHMKLVGLLESDDALFAHYRRTSREDQP